jgi:Tol biopolymer transport system component
MNRHWCRAIVVASTLGVVTAAETPAVAGEAQRGAPQGRVAYSTYEIPPSGLSTQKIYTSTPTGTRTRLVAGDHATDPVWSHDGRWLAYVSGYAEIWRVRADGSERRRVWGHVGDAVMSPSWSPDGRWLAFTRTSEVMVGGYPQSRNAVYVVRRDGSGLRKLHKGWRGSDAAWSADGRVIAFNYGHSLATIRPDGTRSRIVRDDVSPHQLRFSPTGRRLVFTDFAPVMRQPMEPAAVRTLNLSTGERRTVPRKALGGQADSVTWTPDGRRLAYFLNHWVTEGEITYVDAVELRTIRPSGADPRKLATLRSEVMGSSGLAWTR